MGVFTEVSEELAEDFLRRFDVGRLRRLLPIEEGVENTNYLVETDKNRYILTLFEKRTPREDLPFFADLMTALHQRGFPVALPIPSQDGTVIHPLKNKGTMLLEFLSGRPVAPPAAFHAEQAAVWLARLHLAGNEIPLQRRNTMDANSWRMLLVSSREAPRAQLPPSVSADRLDHMIRRSETIRVQWPHHLERSLCHADYFPNNVLFVNGRLSGIIDFYFGCRDTMIYDLAIMLMSWAWHFDGCSEPSWPLVKAIFRGYSSVRVLSDAETATLPMMLEAAGLRFVSSRLFDWIHTPADAVVTRKDPQDFLRRMDGALKHQDAIMAMAR